MGDEMVTKGTDGKSYYIKHPYRGNCVSSARTWDDGPGDLIKHILISYDDNVVSSIRTIYQRKGEIVISSLHCEREANLEMISLREPLTWISGHYGSYCLYPELCKDEQEAPFLYTKAILSLTLGTDSTTYGPYGRPGGGEPFSFKTTTGIGGFHGCVDRFLSAIGVYVQIPSEISINEASPEKSVKLEK